MCFKKCGSKKFTEKLSLAESLVLNSLLLTCQNDECEAKIPYGKYFRHLRSECKVLRYKKINMPEGCMGASEKKEFTPYGDKVFVVGDLNQLFLEQDEELDEDLKKQ